MNVRIFWVCAMECMWILLRGGSNPQSCTLPTSYSGPHPISRSALCSLSDSHWSTAGQISSYLAKLSKSIIFPISVSSSQASFSLLEAWNHRLLLLSWTRPDSHSITMSSTPWETHCRYHYGVSVPHSFTKILAAALTFKSPNRNCACE